MKQELKDSILNAKIFFFGKFLDLGGNISEEELWKKVVAYIVLTDCNASSSLRCDKDCIVSIKRLKEMEKNPGRVVIQVTKKRVLRKGAKIVGNQKLISMKCKYTKDGLISKRYASYTFILDENYVKEYIQTGEISFSNKELKTIEREINALKEVVKKE